MGMVAGHLEWGGGAYEHPGDGLFIGYLNDMYGSLWNQTPNIWDLYREKQIYTY